MKLSENLMLSAFLIAMLLHPFRPFEGSPTFQEEYRGNFKPKFIETELGRQIVAPDTPYVAVAGPYQLYFIDTRFDAETASHIKEQIERASIPKMEEYVWLDEIAVTAELKNSVTGETTFTFDPVYARVFFAVGFNKANPDLHLPVHNSGGDWVVSYDAGTVLTNTALISEDYGCENTAHCKAQTHNNCRFCQKYRVDNNCVQPMINGSGECRRRLCDRRVDTPKEDGETDASYYQRMDKSHWGLE